MSLERLIPGTNEWLKYHADHIQRYNFFSSFYSGKDVLDLACGAGYGTQIIATHDASLAMGIDISEEAISFAEKTYHAENLQFQKMDFITTLSLNRKFDLVVSFETIEHVADPQLFIKVVSELLKPGGKFICSTPNKKKYSDRGQINPYHVSELYYHDFKSLFEERFSIDLEYHQTENIHYRRFALLKEEVEQLKVFAARSFTRRFIEATKWILSKKKIVDSTENVIYYPQESDFTLERMDKFQDDYSVVILRGTKK